MINFFSCKSGKKGGFRLPDLRWFPWPFSPVFRESFTPAKRGRTPFGLHGRRAVPRIPYDGPFGIRGPPPAALAHGKNFSRNGIPVHAALLPARGRGRRAAAAPGSRGQNRPANLVRNMLIRQKG